MRDNLIPILFFLFMVINMYLDKQKRKKRREQKRQEQENLPEAEREQEVILDRAPKAEQPNDLAAEFERRLKKTTEAAEAKKAREQGRIVTDGGRIHRDGEPVHDNSGRIRRDGEVAHDNSGSVHRDNEAVMHDNKGRIRRDSRVVNDKGRIHRDGEAAHDNSGRIHRDGENLKHDKSKVYYDPRGDYSYNEEQMNAAAAAFNAYYTRQQEPQKQKRVKFKHAALVRGFVMAEVLQKPRALKPYEDECR